MSTNDDYTTINFSYYQNYYKVISIDLQRQASKKTSKKINFHIKTRRK